MALIAQRAQGATLPGPSTPNWQQWLFDPYHFPEFMGVAHQVAIRTVCILLGCIRLGVPVQRPLRFEWDPGRGQARWGGHLLGLLDGVTGGPRRRGAQGWWPGVCHGSGPGGVAAAVVSRACAGSKLCLGPAQGPSPGLVTVVHPARGPGRAADPPGWWEGRRWPTRVLCFPAGPRVQAIAPQLAAWSRGRLFKFKLNLKLS